jgi:hypothetical protein
MHLLGDAELIGIKTHLSGLLAVRGPEALDDYGTLLVHIDLRMAEGEAMGETAAGEGVEGGEGHRGHGGSYPE